MDEEVRGFDSVRAVHHPANRGEGIKRGVHGAKEVVGTSGALGPRTGRLSVRVRCPLGFWDFRLICPSYLA